jgi:hypothetical protein
MGGKDDVRLTSELAYFGNDLRRQRQFRRFSEKRKAEEVTARAASLLKLHEDPFGE